MAKPVTSEWARLRPLMQRDKGSTTIVRQVSTPGGSGGGGGVGDLSWVVPQSRTLYGADGITIDGAASGDLSEDRTIALSGTHDILSKHSVSGGAALDVIGLSAASTLARLSPSSDPTDGRLLRSDAAGGLGLQKLTTKEITSRDAAGARNIFLNPVADGSVLVNYLRSLRSDNFALTTPYAGFSVHNRLVGGSPSSMSEMVINRILADELRVKLFVADETRVDRGILYIAKGYGLLSRPFTTPSAINGTATAYFENSPNVTGALFSNNDWVLLQLVDFTTGAKLTWTWGRVSGYALVRAAGTNGKEDPGEQSWTFTLRLGDVNQQFAAGSFCLNWGAPGQGYITLDAVSSAYVPNIAVHVWGLDSNGDVVPTATPYGVATGGKPDMDQHPTKVVMGRLHAGLDDDLTPSGWGFFGDNSYLRGVMRTTNARLDDEGLGVLASSSADFSELDVIGFRKAGVSGEPLFSYFQGYWNGGDVKGRLRVKDDAGLRNATLFLESQASNDDAATASLAARNVTTDTYGALLELSSTPTARGRVQLWAEHDLYIRALGATAAGDGVHRINVQGSIVPYTHDGVFDLGAATNKWRRVYASEIVADTITGETITMSGQEWTYAGDMVIDANAAGATIVYVRNDGGGVASLNVEGDIAAGGAALFGSATVTGALAVGGNLTTSGTVDGVDVSAHAADVDAHHARDHALVGATHTASGLTTGHVLRATSATAFGFGTVDAAVISGLAEAAQDAVGTILIDTASIDFTYNDASNQISAVVIPGGVEHNSLAGLTTGDPHTQYVSVGTARNITAVHTFARASAGVPFILNANTQGQTVTGLRADQLNKSVIAGAGLANGGALTADVTLNVGAGPGITVNADTVQVRLATASGMTLASDTLAVLAANTSIGVAAGGVAVGLGHNYAWTGTHQFGNNITTRHMLPEATDTYDIGSATLLYRQGFLSQLNAVLYAENTAQLIGGWFIIPKYAGKVGAVASASTTVDLGVGNIGVVNVGDFVLIRAHTAGGAVAAEYMQVGSFISGTTWNVTRDLAAAHATDPAWADGTPYLLLGATGDGRIELNASDTPRISLLRQGATYNAQTELVRLGDLNASFGYSAQTWGMTIGRYGAAGQAWLAFDENNGIRLGNNTTVVGWWQTDGSVQVGDGANEHLLATASALQFRDGATVNASLTGSAWVMGQVANNRARVEIDPTNGVRMIWRDGAGVDATRIQLSTAGVATFAGDGAGLTNINGGNIQTGTINGSKIDITHYLAIGNTAFGSDGIQAQYNDGDPRFYVGNGSNRFFRFDGTNISWAAGNSSIDTTGNLTAIDADINITDGASTVVSMNATNGIEIGAPLATAAVWKRSYSFRGADGRFAGLSAFYENGPANYVNQLLLTNDTTGSRRPYIDINANGTLALPGRIILAATGEFTQALHINGNTGAQFFTSLTVNNGLYSQAQAVFNTTLDVSGAVTLGSTLAVAAGVTATNGVLTLGRSTQSMARYKPSAGFTLVDDGYLELPTFSGFVMVICTSEVSTALYAVSASGAFLVGGSGQPDVYRTTAADGFHSIHVDSGVAYLHNRRGGSRSYHIHMFGASTSF